MNNEIIKQSWQNIKEHIRDNYGLSKTISLNSPIFPRIISTSLR